MKNWKNNHKSLMRLLTFSLVLLLSFGAISLSALGASGENGLTISVGNKTADPGATISVPVVFTSDGEAAGMQFDLKYDTSLLTPIEVKNSQDKLVLDFTAGNLPAGFSVAGSKLGNNDIRVIVYHSLGESIPAGSFTVINLKFKVNAAAAPAQESNLDLTDVLISDPSAETLTPDAINDGIFTIAGDMIITGLPAALNLVVGASGEQLSPVAAGAAFTYESDDDDVATVSATGLVTPVAAGNTTITVTANKENHIAVTSTVPVTVIDSQALSIPNVTGDPGATVEVPVMLNTVGLVAGMQFTLNYDPEILSYQGISDGALTSGFTVDAEPVQDGKVNILIVDIPVAAIPVGSGSVAVLEFNVLNSAQPGATSPLALSDIIFADVEGEALPDNGSTNGLFTVTGTAASDNLVLTAGTVTGRAGSNVSVPITLLSEGNVVGIQFALSYDPALLSFKSIDKGALTAGFEVEAEPAAGAVNVLLVKIPVTAIAAGEGTVAKINFTVVSGARTGNSCNLNLNDVVFSDDEGEPLIADKLNNGKFTVASSGGGGGGGGGGSSKDKDDDKEETPSKPDCSFTDLTANHWAYKDIIELCESGIINGYPDGTFGPERSITRAEFAKIIVGVKGTTLVNPAQPTYQDAARSNWYYQYVETATQAGLVMGDGKGKFRPNDQISRQEIAIILVRAMGMQNEAAAKAQEMTSFSDDAQIAAWAKGHVVIAVEQGLINGYPGNPPTFKAKNTATRAEAATMLNRYRNQ